MSFFESMWSKKRKNKDEQDSQKQDFIVDDSPVKHPLHEENASFRYAYCTLVAIAADFDAPINPMEIILLSTLARKMDIDTGMREILTHSNRPGHHVIESMSVMISEELQKEMLLVDIIIMCLSDSDELSAKEESFIQTIQRLLFLSEARAVFLRQYVEVLIRNQSKPVQELKEEYKDLSMFTEEANRYFTKIIFIMKESLNEYHKEHVGNINPDDQSKEKSKKKKSRMNTVIGIDFGTTYCCMAMVENGKAKVIPNKEGYNRTPSVVGFRKDGSYVVGDAAKAMALVEPDKCITSIKRHLLNDVPFKIGNKKYLTCEIAAMILHKLKLDAEAYLQQPVEDVVIAVPAYFSEKLRQIIKNAGSIAGLRVLGMLNEATAAAMGYGIKNLEECQKVLIFDLGGGTFDVSVVELGGGVFEVLAIGGNQHLGGEDFDHVIADYLADEFNKAEGIDLRNYGVAMTRLKLAAEQAKIDLSSITNVIIDLPHVVSKDNKPIHFTMDMSRGKFNEVTGYLVDKTIDPMKKALYDARMKAEDIDKVIMVGGSSRIPAVQEAVKRIIGMEPYKGINPDEVVAAGAAIKGGTLTGEVRDVLLLDVIPISLGIETLGGVFTQLIERNTTIPTTRSQVFSTAVDNQTTIDVEILQGERPMASDNEPIGYLELSGIAPEPKGVPQIEVSFDITSNGLISVSAKDLRTGKESTVTIHSDVVMTVEQIKQSKKNTFG